MAWTRIRLRTSAREATDLNCSSSLLTLSNWHWPIEQHVRLPSSPMDCYYRQVPATVLGDTNANRSVLFADRVFARSLRHAHRSRRQIRGAEPQFTQGRTKLGGLSQAQPQAQSPSADG